MSLASSEFLILSLLMPSKLSTPKTGTSLVYNKQLDGLRAFAVFVVIVEHLIPNQYQSIKDIYKFGYMGVSLFFVLSGFLIGGILLSQRDTYAQIDVTRIKFILKQFYIRRSLRIFPIYYVLLTVLLLVGFPNEISNVILWCYGYAFNFYMAIHNVSLYPLSILWTLCCEEQFYLILPFIVLLSPKKYQLTIIILMILTGIAFRTGMYVTGYSYRQYSVLVFSSFDLFGLGVLLAFLNKKGLLPKINILWAIIPFLLYMYFGNSLLNFKGKSFLYVAVPFFGFTAFLIIASAITGGMGYFGKICELKPISYFGKISYGVYLYHAFCLILIEYILHTYFTNINLPIIIIDVIGLVLTLAVSSISYYYLELPINSLKNKFKY